jgi:serine/threonine protein kinase
MGTCELFSMPLLYVVMECAEENLAQVLSKRSLTPTETREMLEPVLNVVGYLHGQGFVHGHINPANIMADGDQLKLSSDALRRVGESAGDPAAPATYPGAHANTYDPPESATGFIAPVKGLSPAGDVWSLGMTLVEALTQHLPAQSPAGQGDDPSVPQALPEPFLDIARHCLLRDPESRWTVAKIAARLEDRSPVPQAPTLVRPAPPATRPQRAHSKGRAYGVAIVVAVLLAAILLVPKLFRHDSEVPRIPAASLPEPNRQPTSNSRVLRAAQTEAELHPETSRPTRRLITQAVDRNRMVLLSGNTRPEASPRNDRGRVPDDFRLEHLQLQLRLPAEKQQELDQLTRDQQDPQSPNYHKWLTPEQFKQQFSLATTDIDAITTWLQSEGFVVNAINPRSIDFSGTAGQVRNTFHSEIHDLDVNGEKHIANMSDPQIPIALAPAVIGVVSLNDFKPGPLNRPRAS